MATATVIGKFLYENSGIPCVIMKFSPTHLSEANDVYITDGLEYVYPVDSSTSFVNDTGDILLADH